VNRTQKIFLIALLVIGNSHKLAITANPAVLACVGTEALELTESQAYELIEKVLDQHYVRGVSLAEFLTALAVHDRSFLNVYNDTTAEIVAHIRTQVDHFPVSIQEMFTKFSNEELTLAVNEARGWDRFNEFLDVDKPAPIWHEFIDAITNCLQGTKKPALEKLRKGLLSLRNVKGGLFDLLKIKKELGKHQQAIPGNYQAKISSIGSRKLAKRINI